MNRRRSRRNTHTSLDLYWGGAKGGYRPCGVMRCSRQAGVLSDDTLRRTQCRMNGLKRKHLDFAGKQGLTILL